MGSDDELDFQFGSTQPHRQSNLPYAHQPYGDVYGAWRAMQELHREGVIKAIGVSNFHPDRVMDFIMHQEVPPAVNQVETHPFHQQVATQQFLQENKIQMESWGPFAEGKNNIFHNEVLSSIAKKHEKSVAQVIVRWLTQRGVVVIPKSVRKERMAENLDVFGFSLDAQDMNAIQSLETGASLFFDHRDPAMVKSQQGSPSYLGVEAEARHDPDGAHARHKGADEVRFTSAELAELNEAVRGIEIRGQRWSDFVLALRASAGDFRQEFERFRQSVILETAYTSPRGVRLDRSKAANRE